MSTEKPGLAWQKALAGFPMPGRCGKPRRTGLTMLLDKKLGLNETRDLLELAGEYIDMIKLTFGTSALYPEAVLREKIKLIRSYGVDVYPGGTLFEIALWQNKLESFLVHAADLGFTGIEISDGTITLGARERRQAIQRAKAFGFKVVTEVGKKNGTPIPVLRMQQIITDDLESGADQVIIEGRESGKAVGIFDENGTVKEAEMEALVHGLPDSESVLIWEAPLKDQQVFLIKRFGPNVNLGNIAPEETLALEALRCGLRGDTFGVCLERMAADPLRVSRKGGEW
ncbi:MAG: phosphosulfolactate synthase [Firmicutes bacterium]|nr:phosphosulfolactate synthase [Bacillota bacterium]